MKGPSLLEDESSQEILSMVEKTNVVKSQQSAPASNSTLSLPTTFKPFLRNREKLQELNPSKSTVASHYVFNTNKSSSSQSDEALPISTPSNFVSSIGSSLLNLFKLVFISSSQFQKSDQPNPNRLPLHLC